MHLYAMKLRNSVGRLYRYVIGTRAEGLEFRVQGLGLRVSHNSSARSLAYGLLPVKTFSQTQNNAASESCDRPIGKATQRHRHALAIVTAIAAVWLAPTIRTKLTRVVVGEVLLRTMAQRL